jgi:type II secretory pathway pseudopilin PulG
MKRLLRRFRYGERGFTLIELLVVVALMWGNL